MNEVSKAGLIAASALTLVTAVAAYDSLSTASFILYNDKLLLPISATVTIAVLSFGGVFAYPYLQKPAGRLIDYIRRDFEEADELAGESEES